jgi:hypothetical protein
MKIYIKNRRINNFKVIETDKYNVKKWHGFKLAEDRKQTYAVVSTPVTVRI